MSSEAARYQQRPSAQSRRIIPFPPDFFRIFPNFFDSSFIKRILSFISVPVRPRFGRRMTVIGAGEKCPSASPSAADTLISFHFISFHFLA